MTEERRERGLMLLRFVRTALGLRETMEAVLPEASRRCSTLTRKDDRVSEYFVLEGASARGLALSRWRLVELFRACGLSPRPGEDIAPARLQGAGLRVRL